MIIFVRRTTDWRKARKVTCSFPKGWAARITKMINEWNSSLTMSYWDYRAAIKEIAMRNWNSCGEVSQDWMVYGNEEFVAPTDDDDWFSPNLSERLKIDADVVLWKSITHQTQSKHDLGEFWYNNPQHKAGSNNYAIRVGFLKELKPYQRKAILHNHCTAVGEAKALGARFKLISDEILSCYNWHPGSASMLNFSALYSKSVLDLFPPFVFLELEGVGSSFWASPYIIEFCDLLRSIRPKCDLML